MLFAIVMDALQEISVEQLSYKVYSMSCTLYLVISVFCDCLCHYVCYHNELMVCKMFVSRINIKLC